MTERTVWRRLGLLLALLLPLACGGGGDGPEDEDTIPQPDPLPPLLCDDTPAFCGALVPFEPDEGEGYIDQLLTYETEGAERYDYVRRDLMLALRYAAAVVARLAEDWTPGNGAAISIGHMSESDGGTPETPEGQPMFPAGTYLYGSDASVAYYQAGPPDNLMRAVCPHTDGGADQLRCTAAPDTLDARRTALFIAALAEHPQLRVVGVDPLIGPVLDAALDDLVTEGIVDPTLRATIPLAYGAGWEQFHHHHLYVSFNAP